MDNLTQNTLTLCGTIENPPIFSHESHDIKFFSFTLMTKRLSGAFDVIPIIASEDLLASTEILPENFIRINATLRSFNKRSESGNKLIISALAKEIFESQIEEYENTLELSGTVCKTPNYRKTPLGREICDLMLAVNRKYGRSDYLPLIVWGQNARRAAELSTGNMINLLGRLQSREYIKIIDGIESVRTTYEVSVSAFEKII